jgi:Holliday junction resolvase
VSLSGKGRRAKGVRGEREVAKMFEEAGLELRNLEATGDHLVVCGTDLTIHVEVKRQERLRLPLWTAQAETEAPSGAIPLVAYRTSGEPWRVSLRLSELVGLLKEREP